MDDEDGQINDYQTVTPVKIKKVLKGGSSEKIIGVLQAGAVIENASQTYVMASEGFSPLQKTTKYLLFLKKIDPVQFPNMAGMYSIISVNQGKFNLNKTDPQEEKTEATNEQYKKLKDKVRTKHQKDFDTAID